MHTIKAVYDGNNFKLLQPIPIQEEYKVFITFVEPVKQKSNKGKQINKRPLSELKGILKDKVWMSDDFNEPLEEMTEYME